MILKMNLEILGWLELKNEKSGSIISKYKKDVYLKVKLKTSG